MIFLFLLLCCFHTGIQYSLTISSSSSPPHHVCPLPITISNLLGYSPWINWINETLGQQQAVGDHLLALGKKEEWKKEGRRREEGRKEAWRRGRGRGKHFSVLLQSPNSCTVPHLKHLPQHLQLWLRTPLQLGCISYLSVTLPYDKNTMTKCHLWKREFNSA